MSGTLINSVPPGTIGSFTLQNAGAQSLGAGVATLGQSFAQGEVPGGAGLTATINGAVVAVQMDVKTTYPDGSVKMAVLSVDRPNLLAGQSVDVLLTKAAAPFTAPAIDLGHAVQSHSFVVDITNAGQATQHIDVLAALKDALAHGTASVWQQGSLASQARVEIDLGGSQRLVADVTVFKDGKISVDTQFNNDGAMGVTGGGVAYDVKAVLDGKTVLQDHFVQAQYQNLHREFSTSTVDGGQSLGDASTGWLNIKQDIAKLGAIGAVADYDLTLTIAATTLQSYGTAINDPGWDQAFAANGVTQYMPQTGGRPDIGISTAATTSWLISQDPRAAAYSLGQAEAASVVPWHFYDNAHDRWLNTDDYPQLWIDGRGGTGKAGDPGSTGLTQQVNTDGTGWATDASHQPNLSFIPYLLTGERWILDNLNAQASWNIVNSWPAPRHDGEDLVVIGNQIRGAAWSLRQIQDAAYANPDNDVEQQYFAAAAASNWEYLVSQIPKETARQGETHGWLDPGAYALFDNGIAVWQQDFFASTVISAASRGDANAMTYLNWASNYLIGRFQQDDLGLRVVDGAAYALTVYDPTTNSFYKTWAETIAAMNARGEIIETANYTWNHAGYFDAAMATLAGIYKLTGSPEALTAYKALLEYNLPYVSAIDFGRSPNFAVTIPGLYSDVVGGYFNGGQYISASGTAVTPIPTDPPIVVVPPIDTIPTPTDPPPPVPITDGTTIKGTNGNDMLTLATLVTGGTVDLGTGTDMLVLASGGANSLVVSNAEVIMGGTGNDTVTLATLANGITVGLGAGIDSLTLASGGPNTVTVADTETIIGGNRGDTVTLTTLANDIFVDLRGGGDTLVLASGGANTLRAANIETLIGGSGSDSVTFTAQINGASIDLGAGTDRLVLSSTGPNTLTASNVETIVGGSSGDSVTLGTLVNKASIDLGAGLDRLTLASGGPNSLTVSNVETITGGSGNDTVTLGAPISGASVDLGAGVDTLILASGGVNDLTVNNTETIIGGGGNDTIRLDSAVSGVQVDLGSGTDTVTLADWGPNWLTVSNVETINGGRAVDFVTLGAAAAGILVALNQGNDTLALSSAGPNSVTVSGVETVIGGNSDDAVTYAYSITEGFANLGLGQDRIQLASSNGANSITVRGTETVTGGDSADRVTLADAVSGAVIDLRGATDQLILAATGTNLVIVSNVENIVGGAGDDTVQLRTLADNTLIDLGLGKDVVQLANGANRATLSNVETVIGGSGNDILTFTTAIDRGVANMRGGTDQIFLAASGPNTIKVYSAESITGGAFSDIVTLGDIANGTVIGLGGGADKLVLFSGGTNSVSLYSVETVIGGDGNDTVTLNDTVTGATIDLGGGNDKLVIASGAGNSLTVSNVETIIGGNAADTVTLNAPASGIYVDLGGSTDLLTLSSKGANSLTVSNVETIIGGKLNDTVTLGVTLWGGTVDLGAGQDQLTLANGSNQLVTANVERVTGGSNQDWITTLTAARVEGGGGEDLLVGSSGNDTLAGGEGADILFGGGGADQFLYTAANQSMASGRDIIADFSASQDHLVFSGLLHGVFGWRGTGAFLDTGDTQARFDNNNHILQVDLDGHGGAEIQIMLQGVTAASFSAGNFIWT